MGLYIFYMTADVLIYLNCALGKMVVMGNKLQINQSQTNTWNPHTVQQGGKSTE